MALCSAPSAPRNLQVTDTSRTSLQLQWIKPEILNGIILHYRVSISYNTSPKELRIYSY